MKRQAKERISMEPTSSNGHGPAASVPPCQPHNKFTKDERLGTMVVRHNIGMLCNVLRYCTVSVCVKLYCTWHRECTPAPHPTTAANVGFVSRLSGPWHRVATCRTVRSARSSTLNLRDSRCTSPSSRSCLKRTLAEIVKQ